MFKLCSDFWLAVVGCGWLWLVVAGCGWLWLLLSSCCEYICVVMKPL